MPMPTPDDLLATRPEHVRELFMRTRDLVRAVLPDVVEEVRLTQNNAMYGSGRGMRRGGGGTIGQACYISPFNTHVNLGFFRGGELPDPHGLLEGTGKLMRHVKIRSIDDLSMPGLRELIEAAGQQL